MKGYDLLEAAGGIRPEFIEEGLRDRGAGRRKERERRIRAAAALFLICFSLSGIGALAAPDYVSGIFRDIFGPGRAVTGTAYEAREEEAEISVSLSNGKVIIDLRAADPEAFPWRELESIRLKKYYFTDASGKAAGENPAASEPAPFLEGRARIEAEAGGAGSMILVIEELEGGKKADAPLLIEGRWECPVRAE